VLPFLTCRKIQILTRKEINTVPLPIIPVNDLDNLFLNKPLMRNPNSGKKGTNQAKSRTLFISYSPNPFGSGI
jgi:hypothetical protein